MRRKRIQRVIGVAVGVAAIMLAGVLLMLLPGGEAGTLGFWFYVALDVAMPVHPDDRQYLLRFRVRRWLARRNSHADNHAR